MKLPKYSYTFLSTYEICPKQSFHRFVLKDIPFQETPAMKWGTEVHTALEKRVRDKVPLPPQMVKYEFYAAALEPLNPECEMKLGIKRDGSPIAFFDDDVWLRGKADIAVKQGTTALLMDYKTGKKREDPYELEVQALMLHATWPEIERITGHYVWLQDGVVGRAHDVSNTGETLECIQEKADEIEHCHKTGEWRTKPGPLCNWCPVVSCNFNRVRK